MINAQEEERKLVAYDLHDGLIQQLVGARLYLTNCCELCRLHEGGECKGVKSSSEALAEAIIEGRRIVEGLRPAVLDDLGLTAALVDVAQSNARASSWDLKLDVQSLPTEPDKIVGVTLFRIAQEALNNIRKHASADQVRLSVHNGVGIDMVIEDDGKGFRPGHGQRRRSWAGRHHDERTRGAYSWCLRNRQSAWSGNEDLCPRAADAARITTANDPGQKEG